MPDNDSLGLVVQKYKYIEMVVAYQSPARKTHIWDVLAKSSGADLGQIKWYGPWRQYCFVPSASTIFNKGCMEDINNFLEIQMELRKN